MYRLTIELIQFSCYILNKRVKDGESLTINWRTFTLLIIKSE